MTSNVDLVRSLLEDRVHRGQYHPPDTPSLYTQLSPRSSSFDSLVDPDLSLSYSCSESEQHTYPVSTRASDLQEADTPSSSPHHLDVLGPKMRIHSRAPWETELDAYRSPQIADDDDAKSIDSRSLFGSRNKSKLRGKGEKVLKGVAHVTALTRPGLAPLSTQEHAPPSDYHELAQASHPPAFASSSSKSITLVSLNTTPSSAASEAMRTTHNFRRPLRQPPPTQEYPPTPPPKPQSATQFLESQSSDIQSLWEDDSTETQCRDFHPFANPDNLRHANRISHFISSQQEEATGTKSTDHPVLSSVHDEIRAKKSRQLTPYTSAIRSEKPSSINLDIYQRQDQRSRPDSQPTRTGGTSIPSQTNLRHVEPNLLQSSYISVNSSSPALPLHIPRRAVKQKRSGILRLFNKDKEHASEESPSRHPLPLLSSMGPTTRHISATDPDGVTWQMLGSSERNSSEDLREKLSFPLVTSRPAARGGEVPKRILVDRYPYDESRNFYPSSAPPATTNFPSLSLRPVSSFFSEKFDGHILPMAPPTSTSESLSSRSSSQSTTVSTPLTSPLPLTPQRVSSSFAPSVTAVSEDKVAVISSLRKQVLDTRAAWQSQVSEFEALIKDLRDEIDQLRGGEHCESCGRGPRSHIFHEPDRMGRHRVGFRGGTRTLFGGG